MYDDRMKAVLEAVPDGQSVTGAARDYEVAKSTLFDCVSSRVTHGVKPGPRLYLSPEEEGNIRCTKLGYGKTRKDVLGIVELTVTDTGFLRSFQNTKSWW